ncbi:STAS domain-containing protein [Streptomyces sp. WAC 06725]|uniref:STAS domain-containing protein n=1 Tax=Streptomyces sp. WAC 06725 TaxID=2203209 RepID=UPI0037DA2AF3
MPPQRRRHRTPQRFLSDGWSGACLRDRGFTVIELHGEIDLVTAAEARTLLDATLTVLGPHVILDLRPAAFIDCSALTLLSQIRRRTWTTAAASVWCALAPGTGASCTRPGGAGSCACSPRWKQLSPTPCATRTPDRAGGRVRNGDTPEAGAPCRPTSSTSWAAR